MVAKGPDCLPWIWLTVRPDSLQFRHIGSLHHPSAPGEVQPHQRPLPGAGDDRDPVVQPVHHPAAQVQPDAGGFLVLPAVVAGEALLEHPGQVLRPDTDAAVGDDQRLSVPVDPDAAPGGGVFQGVGQYLLHHEGEPLPVRQHRPPGLPKVQGDLFQ
ncbi:RNA polymerase sigma factor sigX, partial [Dysosmobacter welbionis]